MVEAEAASRFPSWTNLSSSCWGQSDDADDDDDDDYADAADDDDDYADNDDDAADNCITAVELFTCS